MDAAAFGLIGVVLGALLGVVASWLAERRRLHREARVAEEVVSSQITEVREAVNVTLESSRWPPGWKFVDWVGAWDGNRRALVGLLSADELKRLTVCYLRMAQLQAAIVDGKERDIDDRDREFLGQVRAACDASPFSPPR